MNIVKAVNSKLSVEGVSNEVSSPGCTVSLFVEFNDKNVATETELSKLEAFEQVTKNRIISICTQVREKWKVKNIAIYIRPGVVPFKEANLIIAISSPYDSDLFQAVSHLVSAVKVIILSWKNEFFKENENYSLKSVVKEELKLENDHLDTEMEYEHHANETIPPHLIQIKADSNEINRRIKSFIERKRDQVNHGNVQDFCQNNISRNENSCARVDALLVRRKDSKSHLRVRRVLNSWGPQTRSTNGANFNLLGQSVGAHKNVESSSKQEQNHSSDDVKSSDIKKIDGMSALEERLCNAEEHVRITGPVPQDVYARLKQIEERILYLEGLSPEYFQFCDDSVLQKETPTKCGMQVKKNYSRTDLVNKLQELEYKLTTKGK